MAHYYIHACISSPHLLHLSNPPRHKQFRAVTLVVGANYPIYIYIYIYMYIGNLKLIMMY